MTGQGGDSDARGLIPLIDQLERLLNASELSEIEIEAGETTLVLRKPGALPAPAGQSSAGDSVQHSASESMSASQPAAANDAKPANAVLAPLTGLFYSSPSPGADAYVKVGGQIVPGQVIGLIEAMKLFNEIKSDRAGRVIRIWPEDGALVKAKQPLIEVES